MHWTIIMMESLQQADIKTENSEASLSFHIPFIIHTLYIIT